MTLVVLGNDDLKEELESKGAGTDLHIEWISTPAQFREHTDADAYMDLLFEDSIEEPGILVQLKKPVIISSVSRTLEGLPNQFIRINGWNTFLKREIIEASCRDEAAMQKAEAIFRVLNRKISWVPDIPGFISGRVVSMIINEAYYALEEEVSTKEEIDIAMKLGTNYPFGPFEWSSRIGLKNIVGLLEKLSGEQPRYQPAPLLRKEVSG